MRSKAIKKAALFDRERAFVYLGKYAGLRRGEILALTKGDIDLKHRTINVNKTIVFKKNAGEIKNVPKSRRVSERTQCLMYCIASFASI